MGFGKLGAFGAAMVMLAGLPLAANAQVADAAEAASGSCAFTTSDTQQINAVLQRFGAIVPDFESFCERLNAANMGVDSNGYTTEELGTTSAVVLVRLYGLDSGVRSEAMTFGFQNFNEVGDEVTEQVLSVAYNDALSGLAEDLDSYIASVNSETDRLRALYQAGVSPEIRPATEPCDIVFRSMPKIGREIEARGSLPEIAQFGEFCEALRQRGIGLLLAGETHVAESNSHAWTAVAMYDLVTGEQGNLKTFALASTAGAGEENGPEDLWNSLDGAMNSAAADVEEFLASVEEERAAKARFFAAGG